MNRNPPTTIIAIGLLVVALNWFAALGQTSRPSSAERQAAVGIVYEDANHNGRRDADEKGLPDVRVSNGREITKTDARGHYTLPVTDGSIIFVIKPSGWMTAISDDNLPRYYYIHEPQGSPKFKHAGVDPTGPLPASVDFPLHRMEEPTKFKALFFGDPQVNNQEEINYLAHDIVEDLIGSDAAFGLTMGDISNNNPSLFESVAQTVGRIGIPWYNVPGNHDLNFDAADDAHSTDSFHRTYGPSCFSFDYGGVHFIGLDDVAFTGWVEGSRHDYKGGLGKDQMEFLRNDLALLPKDQLVVLTMHIPMMEIEELPELLKLLETHPHTFSASAHYHFQQHCFFGKKEGWNGPEPHHHLVNATTCGNWWLGAPDEVGLPHATMRDGAPNGYSIVSFDGNRYSIEFRAARRSADYQMNIWAPEEVEQDLAEKTDVLVNVFAGSEKSKVEMRVGKEGRWVAMERAAVPDPYYKAAQQADTQARKAQPPTSGPSRDHAMPKAIDSPHIWRAGLPAKPPKGTLVVYVRATDMFGQVHANQRIIRIQ
jgi:hypothetical protein